ncbi:hypothetical protein MTO96_018456 [Rhipicephalus appendiculatus]
MIANMLRDEERASLVSLHDSAGRLVDVREVAPDGTFRHRGIRFYWDGVSFREERGLDSGQLTCGQLLASTGVRSDRRPALLLRHGLNTYTSIVPPPSDPGDSMAGDRSVPVATSKPLPNGLVQQPL